MTRLLPCPVVLVPPAFAGARAEAWWFMVCVALVPLGHTLMVLTH